MPGEDKRWSPAVHLEPAVVSLILAHAKAEDQEALSGAFAAFMRSRGAEGFTQEEAVHEIRRVREALDAEVEDARMRARLFAQGGRLRDPRYRSGTDFCPACGRYKDYVKECTACGHLEMTGSARGDKEVTR